jgi:hypothetical protein
MSTVVEGMARTLLDLVVQLSTLSVGGMLQAMLEIEFLQHTLAAYETVVSKATFARVFHVLRAATVLPATGTAKGDRPRAGGGSGGADAVAAALQPELKELAQLLRDNQKATAMQFRCFA